MASHKLIHLATLFLWQVIDRQAEAYSGVSAPEGRRRQGQAGAGIASPNPGLNGVLLHSSPIIRDQFRGHHGKVQNNSPRIPTLYLWPI
jgi:hypothetical protein